jgi:hypothetical protein
MMLRMPFGNSLFTEMLTSLVLDGTDCVGGLLGVV